MAKVQRLLLRERPPWLHWAVPGVVLALLLPLALAQGIGNLSERRAWHLVDHLNEGWSLLGDMEAAASGRPPDMVQWHGAKGPVRLLRGTCSTSR